MPPKTKASALNGVGPETVLPLRLPLILSPLSIYLAIPLPVTLLTFALDDSVYMDLWGQPPAITTDVRLLLTVYALGVGLVLAAAHPTIAHGRVVILDRTRVLKLVYLSRAVAALTLLAYGVWILIAFQRGLDGGTLLSAAAGQNQAIYRLKEVYFAPTSGVTTWMQAGILLGPLLVLEARLLRRIPWRRAVLLTILVAGRGLLASERLALIEVSVAVLVTFAATSPASTRARIGWRRFVLLYLTAWFAVFGVFTIFEYFRSWSTHYRNVFDGSLLEFSFNRLLGYYATALNNGALLYSSAPFEGKELTILSGSFDIPGLDPLKMAVNAGNAGYGELLRTYSNVEFNNRSGLLTPAVALGTVGGFAILLVFALMIHLCARATSAGSIVGMLAYSVSAIALMELPRMFYIGLSRFLPVVIILALGSLWLLHTRDARRLSPANTNKAREFTARDSDTRSE